VEDGGLFAVAKDLEFDGHSRGILEGSRTTLNTQH
jgi:hypothetical protein